MMCQNGQDCLRREKKKMQFKISYQVCAARSSEVKRGMELHELFELSVKSLLIRICRAIPGLHIII